MGLSHSTWRVYFLTFILDEGFFQTLTYFKNLYILLYMFLLRYLYHQKIKCIQCPEGCTEPCPHTGKMLALEEEWLSLSRCTGWFHRRDTTPWLLGSVYVFLWVDWSIPFAPTCYFLHRKIYVQDKNSFSSSITAALVRPQPSLTCIFQSLSNWVPSSVFWPPNLFFLKILFSFF